MSRDKGLHYKNTLKPRRPNTIKLTKYRYCIGSITNTAQLLTRLSKLLKANSE